VMRKVRQTGPVEDGPRPLEHPTLSALLASTDPEQA
jgi:hypothetical protein